MRPAPPQKEDRSAAFAVWFTAAASTATKTLAVAAAALMIAWLTGIEATHRDLTATLRALQKNNRQRQALERIDRAEYAHRALASVLEADQQLIPGLMATVKRLQKKQTSARHTDDLATKQIANLNAMIERIERRSQEVKEEEAKADAAARQREDLRARLAKSQETTLAELRQLGSKRSTISFEIFGLKLAVPPAYAAVAWAVLLIALFLYAADRRRVLIGATVDALNASPPGAVARALHGEVAVWLAPLPANGGVDARALAEAYGWRGSALWPSVFTVGAATLLVAVELRVLAAGVIIGNEFGSSSDRALTLAGSSALVLFTIAAFVYAVSSTTIPRTRGAAVAVIVLVIIASSAAAVFLESDADAANRVNSAIAMSVPYAIAGTLLLLPLVACATVAGSRSKPSWQGVTRRRFVIAAAGGAALLAVAVIAPRLKVIASRRRANRKRVPFGVRNADGFVVNQRTQVIHYVVKGVGWVAVTRPRVRKIWLPYPRWMFDEPIEGTPATRSEARGMLLSVGRYTPDADAKLVNPMRVHLQRASASFETAALHELARPRGTEHADRACRLLVYAINHDIHLKRRTGQPPSFRVYDLLAGLSVRYHRSDYLAELSRLIEKFDMTPIFAARLVRWNDPASRWHARWRDGSRSMRWNGHVLV